MKIFVCIKQVPDTETKIKLSADGLSVDPAGIKWVMNPYDEYAVEEAIKTRDSKPGSQVIVITLGPKSRAGEVLRTALAMGADEGILIDGSSNLDSISTAQAIAKVIQQEGGPGIVFTGKLAIDDNCASVSQMVAEFLSIPHSTVVSKFSSTAEAVIVEREIEGGSKEVVQMALPALVAANKGLNMPRYASLPGIMKAKKKVLKEVDFNSLGISSSPVFQLKKLELPPDKPAVKILTGDVNSQCQQLVGLLRDEAKVL